MSAAERNGEVAVPAIPALDVEAMELAGRRLDSLTKPKGSLGRLEELALALAGMTGEPAPRFSARQVLVLAADHGVAAQGVSAYPADVTAQMVANFVAGGAAINVLARRAGARVCIVDMGVATTHGNLPGLVSRRIAAGTQDMSRGAAMPRDQAIAAVKTGQALAREAAERGAEIVATGEMGIGNSTAASAITATMTGHAPAAVTGRGTGLDGEALAHKVRVIEQSLELNSPDATDPVDVLGKVGGFEIGGLAGVMLECASRRIPVVLDGFIAGAAALIARGIAPDVRNYLVASHRSRERGHAIILEQLELRPLLDLDLRLGEGSGAALALPLVDAAVALRDEMATFASAGVSRGDIR